MAAQQVPEASDADAELHQLVECISSPAVLHIGAQQARTDAMFAMWCYFVRQWCRLSTAYVLSLIVAD